MEELKDILAGPELSIKQALKRMDASAKRILFVVDKQRRLKGTITDGDIRRWILKGKSLLKSVSNIMAVSPLYLKERYSLEEAKNLMQAKGIECLPILNERKEVVSAIWWFDLFNSKFKKGKNINVPVVIMAGGEGVRLTPFTKILPKPLMPIGDKSVIERIFDRFGEYGCKNFYLCVNYKSGLIKAYFNDLQRSYKINYIEESKPLGTAGGLHTLKGKIKSTFFVSNCDILIETDYAELLGFHKKNANKITLVTSMKHYLIPYGVCEIENGGSLRRINEKPEYDLLVNSGMYLLEPEVLKDIPANRPYNFTDLLNSYMRKSKKVGVYPISEKSWLDMGEWEELNKMLEKFSTK